VAALVPSAGTTTLKIELRSDADAVSAPPHPVRVRALCGARPTPIVQNRMEAQLPSFGQLRNNAAECIRLAEAALTPAHKSFFIEMADRWLTLAERAQKDAR
jgi:hypothetical protein